jgi:hypothetical protein
MLSAPVDVVLSALELARAGRFAEISVLFAPRLRALMSPEALETGWNAEIARQAPITSTGASVRRRPARRFGIARPRRDHRAQQAVQRASDEYMTHALAAVERLRMVAAVDDARIFLLGHSLGGTVSPRIAAADPGA